MEQRNDEEQVVIALTRAATALGRSDLDDPGEALTLLAKKRIADSGDKITFTRALELVYEQEPALARAHINRDL